CSVPPTITASVPDSHNNSNCSSEISLAGSSLNTCFHVFIILYMDVILQYHYPLVYYSKYRLMNCALCETFLKKLFLEVLGRRFRFSYKKLLHFILLVEILLLHMRGFIFRCGPLLSAGTASASSRNPLCGVFRHVLFPQESTVLRSK